MRVRLIRNDDGDEIGVVGGDGSSLIYPDDVAFFSDEERDAWREEIRERVARKRPPGFAPWPIEEKPTVDELAERRRTAEAS